MKALSVWQPWAHLIVHGAKPVENRTWSTSYRGPLLIHAGKKRDEDSWFSARAILDTLDPRPEFPRATPNTLAYGAIVGVVRLADCVPSESCELPFANRSPGGFCWVFEDARDFFEPIPYRGMQGLFLVPDHIVAARAA